MKTIKKSVHIRAPREKVWHALFDDASYRAWTSAFQEGSYAETDWQEGSRIECKDESGSGLYGRIVESVQGERLVIEYDGVLKEGGVEDPDDAFAEEIKGGRESYQLADEDGGTRLDITSDMSDEMFDDMDALWDKALEKLVAIAEA